MIRIDVRIRRLVVHGGHAFSAGAFSTALNGEIERRIGIDRTKAHIANRLKNATSAGVAAAARRPGRDRGAEARAAARVAGRLLP
jgi:hypothetical protein